jgi:hypothetical protein
MWGQRIWPTVIERETRKCSGVNLFQWHVIHHKSNGDALRLNPLLRDEKPENNRLAIQLSCIVCMVSQIAKTLGWLYHTAVLMRSVTHKVHKHWSSNFVYYMSIRVVLRNTGYWAQQTVKYLPPPTLNLCTRSNTKFLSKCQKKTATAWFPHSACHSASFTWPLVRTEQRLKNK